MHARIVVPISMLDAPPIPHASWQFGPPAHRS
jgi:hypothetical protein